MACSIDELTPPHVSHSSERHSLPVEIELCSSAASTSANFLLVSIFTCSTCNTCRVIVGSAIALSISVGQSADKPGHVRFGSKADIARHQLNVRFTPKSGH